MSPLVQRDLTTDPGQAPPVTDARSPFDKRLESRPWFGAGKALDAEAAWHYLSALDSARDRHRPYCVYVHVPYCESICRFCALYTKAVRHNADAVLDEYVDHVRSAIARHPFAGRSVAPTTVHFGGGTPLHLGIGRLAMLSNALKAAFGNHATCEWAIEMTTASVTTVMLESLWELGFRRIHLGVQTLDDSIRAGTGLLLSGEAAVDQARLATDFGFACSVDLIMGFDGAKTDALCRDACRLFNAGVRMFSVCELRHRKNIVLTARQHEAQSSRNFDQWLSLWRAMHQLGLKAIHQGQFARTQSDNLYFTHPARGEDCVAIGPYANGSADRLYYGNRLLPDYFAAIASDESPIANAVLYDDRSTTIRDLERELLAHQIEEGTLSRVVQVHPGFEEVLAYWQSSGLLNSEGAGADAGAWRLSSTGSWFVGNMVLQARRLAEVSS